MRCKELNDEFYKYFRFCYYHNNAKEKPSISCEQKPPKIHKNYLDLFI